MRVYWARDIERDSLSRVTHLRTHDDAASPVEAAYRTDGRLDSFWVYRNGASPIGVAHRSYGYSDDGTAVGYTSAVGKPGGNRSQVLAEQACPEGRTGFSSKPACPESRRPSE